MSLNQRGTWKLILETSQRADNKKRKKKHYWLSKWLNVDKDLGNNFQVCWSELKEEDIIVDNKNVAKRKVT